MTATVPHLASVLTLASFGVATGCIKPYDPPAEEGSTDCIDDLGYCGEDEVGSTDAEEGTSVGDSTDETGGPVALEPGECVGNYDPDVVGYRHQCEGSVDFSLEFDIPLFPGAENCIDMQNKIPDHQLCTESHTFGSEPYEQAQVANCCGPWDGNLANEDLYLTLCEADLANQLCFTLIDRLKYHLSNNHFPGFESQAQSIINSISTDIGDCTKQFRTNDVDASPSRLDSKFELGNSAMWPAFVDFTITVKIGEITSFSIPEQPEEWLECNGIQGNDGDTFPKPQGFFGGTPYDTLLASPMTASLEGPLVLGAPVSGQAVIESLATKCSDPWCSSASFVVDASTGEWAIETMELFTASNITLTSDLGGYELADVRFTLADIAPGTLEDASTHVVSAGEASFWIVGRAADDPTSVERFLATNSTDIVATRRPRTNVWYLSEFEIEYIHFSGGAWTITVPASTWE